MAVSQNGTIKLSIDSALTNSLDLSSVIDTLSRNQRNDFATGTGANQANQVFHDQRTLTSSATENLDLAASLVNAFGSTITFTKVKAVFFYAASANTNSVQVTREGTNGVPIFMAAGDGIALTPGAWVCACWPDATGVAVTAATGDLLTITNSAGSTSVTYDVIIIGIG